MTALPPDAMADLYRLVAELEQRLESSFAAHDEAIARQAATAQENALLRNELVAAGDRQAASADILRTIGSVSGNAERSLQEITETTIRLFEASSVSIFVAHGDEWGQVMHAGAGSKRIGANVPVSQLRIGSHSLPGAVFSQNRQIHLPDIDNVDPAIADWPALRPARAAGSRTISGTPLRFAGQAIGVITVHRDRLAPFTADELALLQTFADQAAIAIENARLFNETQQALARQTATSDILRVISQSPTDVQPVFDAIVLTAVRLTGCDLAFFLRCDGAAYSPMARATPEGLQTDARPSQPIDPEANFPSRAIVGKETLHLPDWSLVDPPAYERWVRETFGIVSSLYLPLLRAGECIGLLVLAGKRTNIFGDREIALAESFRDQAVIAIQNARLFNETREALERETSSADILRVISSSPTDVQPVFDAIVASLLRLFDTQFAVVQLLRDGVVTMPAVGGKPGFERLAERFPRPLDDSTIGGMVMLSKQTRQFLAQEDSAAPMETQRFSRDFGFNSVLFTPMIHDGEVIGAIGTADPDARAFDPHQVALIETFARQAVIAIENTRLFNETEEALERQTATADILKVIASSPSDVQPVFEAIAERSNRLIDGLSTAVHRVIDDALHLAAFTRTTPAGDAALQASFPRPLSSAAWGENIRNGETVHIPDAEIEWAEQPSLLEMARLRGFRSLLFVPLLRDGATIGIISVSRREAGRFAPHHVQLLQTFADQAVIAIENVRLFNETREALARQTATSEILRVISQSPTDVQPVFDAIVLTATRLFRRDMAFILVCDATSYWPVATAGPEGLLATPHLARVAIDTEANFPSRVIVTGKNLHLPDWSAVELPEYECMVHETLGINSALYLPLLREEKCIGLLGIAGKRAGSFSESEITLAESFRDQALIAIENTRLFNETKEALAYQTGSSNVLRVIASSPTDVEPVLKAIVESARELCEANDAVVLLRDAEHLRFSAHSGPIAVTLDKWPISRNWTAGRAFVDQKPVHVHDMLSKEGAEFPDARVMGDSTGSTIHTVLSVPLLRGNESVGAILLRRTEVRPFNDKQINLLSTFADQAVIAIHNARLFNETREALERQTATADILKVIASSPSDVQPVFDVIVERAVRLCGGRMGRVYRYDDGMIHLVAGHGLSVPGRSKVHEVFPRPAADDTTAGRAILSRQPNFVTDIEQDESVPTLSRQMIEALGTRSQVTVPMLRGGEPIGAITVGWADPGAYGDQQVLLLETFADQAVIAIENVRLFNETREALERQTATADILKVIASSPSDVQPVFEAIAERSKRLVDALSTTVFRLEDGMMHLKAFTATNPEADATLKVMFPAPLSNFSWGEAISNGGIYRVVDTEQEIEDMRELARLRGYRSMLFVPLLRDGAPIGLIAVTRVEPGPFVEHHVQLLQTFADQAVIAIENVRLFDEVQARTRELSQSLDDLRTAQDRLVQTEKLASLGQLTAGIAHEIKNPLNFVNNFAALSAELTGELNDLLKPVALGQDTREEIDELTGMLKDNLEKIVQHGKRADSIVKNMLLHSREGSGEHRPADINALLDESLNLAYHGARAEKPQFNVTLLRDFDADAGAIELFPQEITRVFLNLIANGFYAVTKRGMETGNSGFEPTVSAVTKNLGTKVEIRIRDNGTGIPEEVKEKMFNPFFTTKPAGEGTGLGLSMSHDIIVKQHGGTIDVETEPGEFTEFRIVLPRTSHISKQNQQN